MENDILEIILKLAKSDITFSDIHIGTDEPILLKTSKGWVKAMEFKYYNEDGSETDFPDLIPSSEDMVQFIGMVEPEFIEVLETQDINRPYEISGWRLRVNISLAETGSKHKISIRRTKDAPPTIAEAGLPATVRILTECKTGLLLISGSTGSGKTTSMASIVNDAINKNNNFHIVSIEDPIEYKFKPIKSFFTQREVGVDCPSFSSGVRSAMRQSPDVILIGEIRDRETAEQAILAGESGHLVIGTLHANSAAETINKILSYFSSLDRDGKLQSLSNSVIGIIHQTLIPKKGDNGYALAVDMIANTKREYSQYFGNAPLLAGQVNTKTGSKDDGLSMQLIQSIKQLIASGKVDKIDAMKAVAGNFIVYEAIKSL